MSKFGLADCSYNCGQMMMKLHIEDHEANYCPKRPHSCEYCQLKGTYQDIQEYHHLVCLKYPVICPNECTTALVERDQLEQHLAECSLVIVECDLREVGCEEMVQRKDLDRHMEEAAHKHLKLSTSYFLHESKRQDEEMAKLRKENEQLRKDLSALVCEGNRLKKANLTVNYQQLCLHCRWENNESFETLSGYTLKINLWKTATTLEIELTHVKSTIDDILKWPKAFSIKARLLNQAGDERHREVIGQNLKVTKGGYNDKGHIRQEVVENPPPGVQYTLLIATLKWR